MTFIKQFRGRFLVFLKNHFNPWTRRLIAQSSRGPFAIVHHVGRRSGKPYETPIIVVQTDQGFVFELTYGPEVDWFKNVQAASHFTLRWHQKDYVIQGIQPLDSRVGRAAFWAPVRWIMGLIKKEHFYLMVIQPD